MSKVEILWSREIKYEFFVGKAGRSSIRWVSNDLMLKVTHSAANEFKKKWLLMKLVYFNLFREDNKRVGSFKVRSMQKSLVYNLRKVNEDNVKVIVLFLATLPQMMRMIMIHSNTGKLGSPTRKYILNKILNRSFDGLQLSFRKIVVQILLKKWSKINI